jgi:GT2 family glycosyltransferase
MGKLCKTPNPLAPVTRQLGFLDEGAHLLDDDDHDLNMRASKLGFTSSYLPMGSYAPKDLSAKRKPAFRKFTPQEIKEEENR